MCDHVSIRHRNSSSHGNSHAPRKISNVGRSGQKTHNSSNSLLPEMTNFQFIIALITVARTLLFIRGGVSKKIQGHSFNLYYVVGQVREARDNLEFERIDAGAL